mgnify:CR=1 FL=1
MSPLNSEIEEEVEVATLKRAVRRPTEKRTHDFIISWTRQNKDCPQQGVDVNAKTT